MTGAWLGPRALAQITAVSTDTLRHYERLGLLVAERTRTGYRRYPPHAVERVRLIRRALTIGFSLRDLAAALEQRRVGKPPCQRVRKLVGDKLEALDAQLTDLAALRDEMKTLLDDWDARLAGTPPGQAAKLLDMLAGRPALDRPAPSSKRLLRRS